MAAKRRWTEMDKDHLPLRQLIASYQLHNRAVGKSPTTLAWYQSRLEMFARFLPTGTLGELTPDNARAYIVHLQDRSDRFAGNPFVKQPAGKLSSAYIHGCVRAARAFASWLHAEGYTDINRLKAVKPPKVQKKVVPVLSDDEVRQLLDRFDVDDPFGARNFALVYTMLDCGLRASELCELRLIDAHLNDGYLKVLGKGNKERLVPLGTGAQAALLRWRDRFRSQFTDTDSPNLFLNASGEPFTRNALQEVVQRAARSSGVRRAHCHLLRHTFATNYLVREVGDPFRLQQILGHTTLEMVRHYVATASVQQSLTERRSSPMDLILSATPNPYGRRLQPGRKPVPRVGK